MNDELLKDRTLGTYDNLNRKERRKKGQRSGFKVSTVPNRLKSVPIPRGRNK